MPVWLDPLFPCPLALFPCRTALPCQTPPSQHCGAEGCSQCPWLWVPAWGSVSTGLRGTAWSLALPQCWQGAAVHISGTVPAVTWQLPGAGAEPTDAVLPKHFCLPGPRVGTLLLTAQVCREVRESNPLSSLQFPEKSVVIH